MNKEIRSEYRAHYPDGRLLKRYRVLTIVGFRWRGWFAFLELAVGDDLKRDPWHQV
jgi:hypothetical protein